MSSYRPPLEHFMKEFIRSEDKNNKFITLKFNLISSNDIVVGENFNLTLHYNDEIFDDIEQK